MPEKKGKIVSYHESNRQGRILPEGGGPEAIFYLPIVSNPEPAPRVGDKVLFDAPEPRKKKNGKTIQDAASSVTIEDRAPEPKPEELARQAERKKRAEQQLRKELSTPLALRKSKERGKGKDGKRRDSRGGKNKDSRRDGRGPSKDSSERRSRPSSDAKRTGDFKGRRRERGASDRAARPKVPFTDRIRYPLGRDVPKNVMNMKHSNPGLVLDKFIQWPNNAAASSQAEKPATEAPNNWELDGRHRAFFLNRTIEPLYKEYEKTELRFNALRARNEESMKSLEQLGYTVSSVVVTGPWRFASQESCNTILERVGLSFEPLYAYPHVNAASVLELLKSYNSSLETACPHLAPAIESIEQDKSGAMLFDGMPTSKAKGFAIEKALFSKPRFEKDGSLQPFGKRSAQRLNGFFLGYDMSFSFSVAAKDPETAKALSAAIKDILEKVNQSMVTPGDKEKKLLATGVLFA